MQNKANLLVSQMNVTYVKTNNLQQPTMDNEPIKQSQTEPNESREVAGLNTPKRRDRFIVSLLAMKKDMVIKNSVSTEGQKCDRPGLKIHSGSWV